MTRRFPLTDQLYYSDDWQDVTSYTSEGATVSATHGTSDEQSEPAPGSLNLSLFNRDGRFHERDGNSPLFGLIGRNTPARTLLWPDHATGPMSLVEDDFDRTEAAGWGTATSGQAWTAANTGAGASSVGSGLGVHSVSATATALTYLAGHAARNLDLAVTIDAPTATGGEIWAAVVFRGEATDDFWQIRVALATSGDVDVSLRDAAGDLYDAAATADVGLTHVGDPLHIRVRAIGTRIAVRMWDDGDPEPTTWQGVFDHFEHAVDGWVGLKSAAASGNTNVGLTVTYDDLEVRPVAVIGRGEVPSWPPRRDRSEVDARVSIEAAGILRRLGIPKKPLQSPLRRAIVADSPTQYWPLEDGGSSSRAGSGIPGGRTLTTSGVSFGAQLCPAGSRSAVDMTGTDATISGSTGIASADATSWEYEFVAGWDTLPTDALDLYHVVTMFTPGATVEWWAIWLSIAAGAVTPKIFYFSDSLGMVGGAAGTALVAGETAHMRMHLAQVSANIEFAIYVDGVTAGAVTLNTATLRTPTRLLHAGLPEVIVPAPAGYSAPYATSAPPSSLSHAALWYTARSTAETYLAADGYAGEAAGVRIQRACALAGVDVIVQGDPDDTAAMGPEPVGTWLDVATEAANTDGGVWGESIDDLALHYRTIRTLYNQSPALELDYSAGHIHPPFEPTPDDARIRNEITATKPNGSFAVAIKTSGALSTAAPPEGVGPGYEGQVDPNPEDDADLTFHAFWALWLGTWDEERYPALTVFLHNARFRADPALAAAALSIRPGDVVSVANPPHRNDDARILVTGRAVSGDPEQVRIGFLGVPYGPYEVLQTSTGGADTNPLLGWMVPDSLVLAEDVDTTETAWDVTATPLLTTSASSYPVDMVVGGERVTVTACSGGSNPQTLTVTRSVEGVVKSHDSGDSIRVATPIILTMR